MKKLILSALLVFGVTGLLVSGCTTKNSYKTDKASARVKSCSPKYGCEAPKPRYTAKDRPAPKKYEKKCTLGACAKSNS